MAPLNHAHQIFTSRWQKGLLAGREAAMPAKVKVFTRVTTTTNHTTTATETAIYTGYARIQPLRQVNQNSEPGDVAFVQTVRFQIKLDASLLVPQDTFVRVTECILNPGLVDGHVYTLREVLDGSNPIERTFEAVVDTSA